MSCTDAKKLYSAETKNIWFQEGSDGLDEGAGVLRPGPDADAEQAQDPLDREPSIRPTGMENKEIKD